jgi:MFS family permease
MRLILSDRQRSLVGVIAAMMVVNLVYGITFPLMALVLAAQHVSSTLIGLSTLVQAAAMIVIAPYAPGLLSRFSPSRLMQVMAVALAILFIVAGLLPNVWFWFPLRFIMGAACSMLWISSEALINKLAVERWRGRIIAIYASVGAGGFALGPLILIMTGSEGMVPFLVTSFVVLLAALPLYFARHQRMTSSGEDEHGIWKVFLLAPVIMLANVVYASVAESLLTFFPLYGMEMGITQEFSLGLMTLMGAGGMVLVLPLGWVADHVNRMAMLIVLLLMTMMFLLAFPYVLQLTAGYIFVFAFVFGGTEGMIYTLGVVLIGERFAGAQLTAATTAFTACWGAGTVLGPLLVGIGMDWFGNDAMVIIIFVFFLIYLPLPVMSWLRSRREQKLTD